MSSRYPEIFFQPPSSHRLEQVSWGRCELWRRHLSMHSRAGWTNIGPTWALKALLTGPSTFKFKFKKTDRRTDARPMITARGGQLHTLAATYDDRDVKTPSAAGRQWCCRWQVRNYGKWNTALLRVCACTTLIGCRVALITGRSVGRRNIFTWPALKCRCGRDNDKATRKIMVDYWHRACIATHHQYRLNLGFDGLSFRWPWIGRLSLPSRALKENFWNGRQTLVVEAIEDITFVWSLIMRTHL